MNIVKSVKKLGNKVKKGYDNRMQSDVARKKNVVLSK